MKCPTHDVALTATDTRYGVRHGCPVNGCTVVCWDGSTSTPADQETRDLRHACHDAFDPLWKRRERFKHRAQAYVWLQSVMGLPASEAHVGMFDAEQCRKLLAAIKDAAI